MSQGLLYGIRSWWSGSLGSDRVSASGASGGVSGGSGSAQGATPAQPSVLEISATKTTENLEEVLRKKQEAAQPTTTTPCEDPDPETEEITTPNKRSYIDDLQNFID